MAMNWLSLLQNMSPALQAGAAASGQLGAAGGGANVAAGGAQMPALTATMAPGQGLSGALPGGIPGVAGGSTPGGTQPGMGINSPSMGNTLRGVPQPSVTAPGTATPNLGLGATVPGTAGSAIGNGTVAGGNSNGMPMLPGGAWPAGTQGSGPATLNPNPGRMGAIGANGSAPSLGGNSMIGSLQNLPNAGANAGNTNQLSLGGRIQQQLAQPGVAQGLLRTGQGMMQQGQQQNQQARQRLLQIMQQAAMRGS